MFSFDTILQKYAKIAIFKQEKSHISCDMANFHELDPNFGLFISTRTIIPSTEE